MNSDQPSNPAINLQPQEIVVNTPEERGALDVLPDLAYQPIAVNSVIKINGRMFRVRKKTDKDLVLRPLTKWEEQLVNEKLTKKEPNENPSS